MRSYLDAIRILKLLWPEGTITNSNLVKEENVLEFYYLAIKQLHITVQQLLSHFKWERAKIPLISDQKKRAKSTYLVIH